MRKRYTKIICAAVAAISAFGLVFSSACSNYKWKAVDEKDNYKNVTSNGGFLVQTDDYVYFVNGKASNTDDNTFGSVLKGSVQRIKKSDLNEGNYSSTQTIVPSVIYSGQYNAGIYIYGDYIYYTTPSTQKDGSGNILNGTLDFKRSKLDGSETDRAPLWQCEDNGVDYRFVEENGKVYILYARNESLFGTGVTNIHSIDCETKEDKLLAYNVGAYAFDLSDPTNGVAYYTMSVPYTVGEADVYEYNQLYRVRADVKDAPREYDFSAVQDYDAEKDPVYVNYGDFVFDGIGTTQNQTEGRVTQFNFNFGKENQYDITNAEYNYSINEYVNGVLYFTRTSKIGSSVGIKYRLADAQIDGNDDGRVDSGWDAIKVNGDKEIMKPFLYLTDGNNYTFFDMDGKTYAFYAGASGITKGELNNGIVENSYLMSKDESATILQIRREQTSIDAQPRWYMYYSVTGGNGYTFSRIAIDGKESDYNELSEEFEWDKTWTYRGVKILDLDACTDWYSPEFVGNTLVFASETFGMSAYNYIMACNLEKDGKMMSNKELHEYNEKFEGITDKIEAYDEETNADGSAAFTNLSNALKYLHYTGDEGYLDELINAYVEIEGRDKEYLYSERSAEIYHEFAQATGDWKDYNKDVKKFNGKDVYSTSHDYYYGLLGKMTKEDAEDLKESYKTQYMQEYPVDNSTWWEKLSTGGKVGFIIGMVAAGLVVVGGLAVLTLFIVKRLKDKKDGDVGEKKYNVDITDDKDVDVYGDNQ